MSTTSTTAAETDRRHHPRAPLGPALQQYTAGASVAANVLDVSEGGARLAVSDPGRLDDSLELWLPLMDREGKLTTCHVKGEVVRREEAAVGVRFERLLPLHFLQLRDYVWRASQPPEPRSAGSRLRRLFRSS